MKESETNPLAYLTTQLHTIRYTILFKSKLNPKDRMRVTDMLYRLVYETSYE